MVLESSSAAGCARALPPVSPRGRRSASFDGDTGRGTDVASSATAASAMVSVSSARIGSARAL